MSSIRGLIRKSGAKVVLFFRMASFLEKNRIFARF